MVTQASGKDATLCLKQLGDTAKRRDDHKREGNHETGEQRECGRGLGESPEEG